MRHLKTGRKLKRTASHRAAMLKNMATSLFRSEHKAIRTTVSKAKELRPFVERLITRARRAYRLQRSGASPTQVLHNRRLIARYIQEEAVVQELFDVIAPAVADRNGGYTRIVKLGFRQGDGAQEAIIQLVDWSPPQDGVRTLSTRKRRQQTKQKAIPAPQTTESDQQSAPTAQGSETAQPPAMEHREIETLEHSTIGQAAHTDDGPEPETSTQTS